MAEMTQQGRSAPIWDAVDKVTGNKNYTDDIPLPKMLYGKLLLSDHAHARIVSIDTGEAEAMPGVRAVATYKNTPDTLYNSAQRYLEQEVIKDERIFSPIVRFVGDRVAAVAAESQQIADAAVKKIKVVYEDLPAVFSAEDALKGDAPLVHEERGSNAVAHMEAGSPIPEEVFEKAPHVMEGVYTTPAIHQAAMERHTAEAFWDGNGKLTVICPGQNTFAFRIILASIFSLPLNKVRVISPAIGGGFGGKLELLVEPVAAALSLLSGRPVRLTLSRKESMLQGHCRHASVEKLRTAYDDEGRILAMDFCVFLNTGAYTSSALNVGGALLHKVFPVYRIPYLHVLSVPTYTNTIVAGAMRGYGSPQIFFGMQRQMAEIARQLCKDPLEVQRLNLVDPDALNPLSGERIGNPRVKDCLERCSALMGKADPAPKDGRWAYGTGIAVGVHGNNCYGVHRDNSSPMIRMNEDGTCLLVTGSHDMGTDTLGMQMEMVSRILGIRRDHISVQASDTDISLWHIGDYASRGVFVVGEAVRRAAELMKKELQAEASKLLLCPPERIALIDEHAYDMEDPTSSVDLKQVMIHCQSTSHRELCIHYTYEAERGAFSYGVHMARVRVDKATGEVKILKYAAVHDVGKVLNPLMIEGQLQGAVAMGIGYALSEGIFWDDKGNPSPLGLKKYHVPMIFDMPDMVLTDFITTREGEPGGPYGAKSLGESPVVPAAPAIVNAISDALGMQFNDLPVTKEKILKKMGSPEGRKKEAQL